MVTREQAEVLGRRLAELECVDPEKGDGLFLYVFNKEPSDQASRYESHVHDCEHCRVALEVYRYKRHVAELLGKDVSSKG